MTTERVVSRYPATIAPSAARGLRGVTERTGGDTEREMEKIHLRAVIAQQSIDLRVTAMEAGIHALATTMTADMRALHEVRVRATAGLDPETRQDAQLIDFGEQVIETTKDIFLKALQATGVVMASIAGEDIRDGIRTEPPPAPAPTVIEYTGPQLEPAPFFTTRPKYVIKER